MQQSRLKLSVLLAATLSMTACASMPQTPAEKAEAQAVNDPLEPMNRVIFDVNDFLDRLLIRPLAELYRVTVPPPLRDRVANIMSNMGEPVVLANNLLQGEFGKAGTTTQRFLVNSTVGVGGMFEVANDWKLPRQNGDFGQTLHTWGINGGPYLVLPLFGPSNFRDAIGMGVDAAMSPWQYVVAVNAPESTTDTFGYTTAGVGGLVKREQYIEPLDALREGSLDFYAQMRSITRQHRAKELGEAMDESLPKFEDYENETKK